MCFESIDLSDGGHIAGAVRLQEFLGLLPKLFEFRLSWK
jgi:hypothetical protein